MINEFPVYYNICDVKEFLDETLTSVVKELYDPQSTQLQDKIFRLREIYGFYALIVPCKKALIEYEQLVNEIKDNNSIQIQLWAKEYRVFFEEHVMLFGNLYQTEMNNSPSIVFLEEHNLYVDIQPLLPIYKFWTIMWNLHWN